MAAVDADTFQRDRRAVDDPPMFSTSLDDPPPFANLLAIVDRCWLDHTVTGSFASLEHISGTLYYP